MPRAPARMVLPMAMATKEATPESFWVSPESDFLMAAEVAPVEEAREGV